MTTLRPCFPPSTILTAGADWPLVVETFDSDGNRTGAVTPAVTVTRPDASTASVTLTYRGSGVWQGLYTTLAAGRHLVHISTPEDAVDAAAYVDVLTTVTGMPNASDVSIYLGANAGTWSMAEIGGALAAERTAQRDKCGERAVYPDSLREALFRRVHRNLAMRRLPLAITLGDADTGPSVLPGRDPEVRRLEGPYRRRTVG